VDKEKFLSIALEEAKKAFNKGEVPVGAIIVKEGKVISKAHNSVEELKDPTAHAEILAIREACRKLNTKFLEGCELYVTLEPCVMCSYALVLARVEKVIFSAFDKKHGGVVSIFNILDEPLLNYRVRWEYYPLEEASELLSEFFRKLRNNLI